MRASSFGVGLLAALAFVRPARAELVEAGCKVAIGTRLKRAGMHWTQTGANAIMALRCSKLNGRYEDFWERRSIPMEGAA